MNTPLKAKDNMFCCVLFLLVFQLCFPNTKTVSTKFYSVHTALVPEQPDRGPFGFVASRNKISHQSSSVYVMQPQLCSAVINIIYNNPLGVAIPMLDSDGDTLPNHLDIDDDNDGIPDLVEQNGNPARDTDGDGTIDSLDLDSDGDGLYDIMEAGHAIPDSDGDGRLDDPVGNNGLSDRVENQPDTGIINYKLLDTDKDGLNDFQDMDDDGDSVGTIYEFSDPNKDGNPADSVDNDEDGIPDYLDNEDSDVDGDGLTHVYEVINRTLTSNPDTDGDGINDGNEIKKGYDPLDPCSPNESAEICDPDKDGLSNLAELSMGIDPMNMDTDGDGIDDGLEIYLGSDPNNPDTDGDGISDGAENLDKKGKLNNNDQDKDGVLDLLDTDTSTINVFKALTPNGDGDNDVWTIENIEMFPNNVVELYKPSGQMVFRKQRYMNDWRGFSNTGSNYNKKLPVGTYFYMIKLDKNNAENKPYKGYIYITY